MQRLDLPEMRLRSPNLALDHLELVFYESYSLLDELPRDHP